MKNLMKGIKKTVNRIFGKKANEKEPFAKIRERENVVNTKNVGSEKVQGDLGKKVFERTGHEGVGQSSTLEPQNKEGAKTAHGRKKYYHKKTKPGNKVDTGKMSKM